MKRDEFIKRLGDGVTSEMSSVSGSVDSGFALTHTIVVGA